MPSFAATESQYQTATTNPSHPSDQTYRKSHDKTAVGNTFLYTPPNGDTGHFDPHQPDHHQIFSGLKNGSAYSLNGPRSSIGSHSRELLHSKDSSTNSLAGGAVRESKDTRRGSGNLDGQATTRSTEMLNGTAVTSKPLPATPQVNGESASYRSSGSRPTLNGDYYRYSEEIDPKATIPVSTSAPDAGRSSLEPDRLAPAGRTGSGHRYSSPPAPTFTDSSQILPPGTTLVHRHTLQVPRNSTSRRNSREASEDTATTTGRFSPTAGMRRTSISLARRTTRSIQSDLPADEVPPDEDAARWAEAIKQKRARKKRREEEDDDRVIVGTKVDQNHVNWVTAYNMLTGIRFTVSRINAKMDRELTDADFEAKQKFSFDVTGNELTPSAKYDFKFKDYAPWVFRRLRAQFKLDPADYLMSLTSKYILSELGSPGKSGSFFYFSRDYKYIIKTIHHSEHKLLRKILRDYYSHIVNNPNTLISQFYGLHRVKMAYGRKIHFVVMNNLFPPHRDIHQMYDLKGSTIGRDLSEADVERNPRATMKDLNWLRRNRHIECGPMKKEIFIAQLKRDVHLLQKLQIMDYSLLVGIHDLQKGNEEKLRDKTLQVFQPGGDREEDENPSMLLTRTPSKLENARKVRELRLSLQRERPVPLEQTAARMPDEILDERKNLVFYSDDGGFRATHENGQPGDEIYYLGVIDCLTHYGMVKKVENFWKGLSHNRLQISPIPPESYGERFINFITGITMSKEEAEREAQARASGDPSMDPVRGQGFHDPAVERTMRAAEKQVVRDGPEPQARTLTTMRDPTDASSTGGPSTLPVVQEDGENGSTGSVGDQNGQNESGPADVPPPVPEKDGARPSNRYDQHQSNGYPTRQRRGTLSEKSEGVDHAWERENGRFQVR